MNCFFFVEENREFLVDLRSIGVEVVIQIREYEDDRDLFLCRFCGFVGFFFFYNRKCFCLIFNIWGVIWNIENVWGLNVNYFFILINL